MKVMFLDHDGVICLGNNWGGRYKKYKEYLKKHPQIPLSECPVDIRFDDFDSKAIIVLNEIIRLSGAEIVVSSNWKNHATLSELGDFYHDQGIAIRPIDCTSSVKTIDPEWYETHNHLCLFEEERSMEIKDWLSKHPEVTYWVAIDDLDMDPFLSNFVHTRRHMEGIKQTGIKEKVLAFLN